MKNKIIIVLLATVVSLIVFFFLNPFGIKLGYFLSGGREEAVEEKVNTDSLLIEYNKQVADYNRYKDSTNPTQLKWAENAKEKANKISLEYNAYFDKEILKTIGD